MLYCADLSDLLRKMLRCPCFLDSSTLADLRMLFDHGLLKSDVRLVLLASRGCSISILYEYTALYCTILYYAILQVLVILVSRGYLTRPWCCLLEILEA